MSEDQLLNEANELLDMANDRIKQLEAALWKIVGLGENTQRAIPIAIAALDESSPPKAST